MANLELRRNQEPTTTNRPAYPLRRKQGESSRWIENFLGFDPFREMYPLLASTPSVFWPDFEVQEANDRYIITGDLPGVAESDLDISLSGNQLTISGKREQEEQQEALNYFCCERSYGSFLRSFTLPQGVSMDQVQADLKGGVLTVIVPKSPELQPRKIALGAGNKTVGKAASS